MNVRVGTNLVDFRPENVDSESEAKVLAKNEEELPKIGDTGAPRRTTSLLKLS